MKLYKAKLSTEIVYVSEHGYDEPLIVLKGYVKAEMAHSWDGTTVEVIDEISEVSDVPKKWRAGIPYGLEPANKTCEQLVPIFKKAEKLKDIERLKRQKEELEKDIKQLEQELENI